MAESDTESRGGLVALLPADPDVLVVDADGAETAAQMHLTLLFLGSDVTEWDAHRREGVVVAARAAAAEVDGPIEAHVAGHATFNPTGGPTGEQEPCAVYLVGNSTELAPLHEDIEGRVAELLGDDLHPQHAPWLPHATGGYGLTAADLSYAGPVVFDRILVKLAGVSTEIPLVDTLTTAAREAFAHGWALTGGPMTDRVRAACQVAIAMVHESDDTDEALAATIQLGTLEGTWAAVFDRREQLTAQHVEAITAAWRALMSHVDVDTMIRKLRRSLVLEAAPGDTPDQRDHAAEARAGAENATHSVIYPSSPEYQAAVHAIAASLKDSEAEGSAGAVAIAAEQGGHTSVAFDLAFTDAHDALGDLDSYWGDATGWLGQVLDGQAADLGNALAGVARDGGSFEEMQAAAEEVLSGTEIRAIDTIIDLAMSQSFSRGAKTLYQREGVSTVDYVTAGGGRVCPRCLDVESENPWPVGSVPQPGLHPYCRCVLVPADPLEAIRGMRLSRYTDDAEVDNSTAPDSAGDA